MTARAFTNRIHIGLDVVAPLYATRTEFGERFREIAATDGVPAAVRWRAAQFKGVAPNPRPAPRSRG
jgi:enoyl-CoA hydratase